MTPLKEDMRVSKKRRTWAHKLGHTQNLEEPCWTETVDGPNAVHSSPTALGSGWVFGGAPESTCLYVGQQKA